MRYLLLCAAGFILLMTGCSTSMPLDSGAREALPGSFVKLSQGMVHYEFSGPENGGVVVLVHGFSTPMFIWEKTAPALREAGFRVLVFDLYGRGYSDRPKVENNEDLFDTQLLELLNALDIQEPVNLMGLSMGGAIAAIFTARHPEKVNRLGLVDPAGFPVKLPFAAKLVKAPILGDMLMGFMGSMVIKKSAAKSFHDQSYVAPFVEKFQEQMQYKGYKRSILDTLRHFDLSNQAAAFEKAGSFNKPILLIWGRQDNVVPYENHEKALAAMPNAEFHAIDQAGHVPHYEQAQVVSPLIVQFLRKG